MIGLAETWRIALAALCANAARAALSALGVVIGTASIVLVLTVASTGRRYIIAQIEAVGSNMIYAEHVGDGAGRGSAVADNMTLADLDAVRTRVPGVVYVAGTHDLPVTFALGRIDRTITLVGVTEEFQRIRNLRIVGGRYFDPDDLASHRKVCLLTRELATAMFPGGDPAGRVAKLGELAFTVIGVFIERVSTFGTSEIQRDSAIIPFGLLKYYTGDPSVKVLYAQEARADLVATATGQIEAVLASRHRAGARYQAQNLTSLLQASRNISSALTIVFLIVALLALFISGIGIMNVMLVTVVERTREIGIRKSLGARRQEVLGQFLIEAGVISGGGALVGVLLALVVVPAVQPFVRQQVTVSVPILSVPFAFAVSSSIGLVFGYVPARRAASLDPVESLRYE